MPNSKGEALWGKNLKSRFLYRNSGFTAIELIIAIGVSSILIISSVIFIEIAVRKQQQAQTAAFDAVLTALVGANFPKTMESSQFSQDFLHLPLSRSCTSDSDHCLRNYNLATGSFEVASTSDFPPSITGSTFEFYRDHIGDLESDLPIVKMDASMSPATYTYTKPSRVKELAENHQVHATWPLIDSTSQPLPMMVRLSSVRLSIPGFTATSGATVGSELYAQVKGGALTSTEISGLVGQPILIYNQLSPEFYVVKVIEAISLCSTNLSACKVLVPSAPIDYRPSVVGTDVRLQLTNFDSSLASMLPAPTSLPFVGDWVTNSASQKIFPDISASIDEPTINFFMGNSFDPRKLLHYFHSAGIRGDLIAAPVILASYRLATTAGRTDLVRDVFSRGSPYNSRRMVVIENVPGPVVFARRLGTSELKLVVFDTKRKPAAATTNLSGISQTYKGSMKAQDAGSMSMERRVVNYPLNCEMTFTTESTCGDGDVVDYYSGKPNEENADGNSSFNVVLGYWLEKVGSETGVPTQDNWYAMGYDTLNLDNSQVGLKMINSNEKVSANHLLQDEVERVTSLLRFAPPGAQYRFYSTVMLCNDWEDNQGTLTDATFDNFSAGMQVCQAPEDLTTASVPGDYSAVASGLPACPAAPSPICSGGTVTPYYVTSGGTTTCEWAVSCPATTAAGGGTGDPYGGAGAGSCFVAGTQVTMADGTYKSIENVKDGESVRAYDEVSDSFYNTSVFATLRREKQQQQLHHFTFSNGVKVTSTAEHPFYVLEIKDFISAQEIYELWSKGTSMTFVDELGRLSKIVSIGREQKVVPVFNLSVKGLPAGNSERGHSYFANGMLVHNMMFTGVMPDCN